MLDNDELQVAKLELQVAERDDRMATSGLACAIICFFLILPTLYLLVSHGTWGRNGGYGIGFAGLFLMIAVISKWRRRRRRNNAAERLRQIVQRPRS